MRYWHIYIHSGCFKQKKSDKVNRGCTQGRRRTAKKIQLIIKLKITGYKGNLKSPVYGLKVVKA